MKPADYNNPLETLARLIVESHRIRSAIKGLLLTTAGYTVVEDDCLPYAVVNWWRGQNPDMVVNQILDAAEWDEVVELVDKML